MNLFQHQKEGIAFLNDQKRAILADEMGLGKTRQAIIAAGGSDAKGMLVVCPASLKINWEREIRMVYSEDQILVVHGGNSEMAEEAFHSMHPAWVIVNYDILGKHSEWIKEVVSEGELDTIILDEAHYIKDTKTHRTKAALALTEKMERVYLLTGTPIMNRPIELYALLRAVKHHLAYREDETMSSLRKKYGMRYCGAYFRRLGNTGRGFWDETGATRLPELKAMTSEVILRRTKSEVLDLPAKIRTAVPMELSSEWQKVYDGAWDTYLTKVKGKSPEEISNILTAQNLVELMQLKQVCSRAKIDRIVADIENAAEQGEKVIVFSQFTNTIKDIAERLNKKNIGAVTLTGDDDAQSRQRAVDAFQEESYTKVFVANIKAGGVGLTLTAASIVIFADMDWSPAIHNQAEDRAHRIGQTGTVNIYYYVLQGTIEEDIMDVLQLKQETIGLLTDGETSIQAFTDLLINRSSLA